jgi:hypothetical protein
VKFSIKHVTEAPQSFFFDPAISFFIRHFGGFAEVKSGNTPANLAVSVTLVADGLGSQDRFCDESFAPKGKDIDFDLKLIIVRNGKY